jgi:hypothetical protein
MTVLDPNSQSDVIEQVIAAETERALARFRTKDFAADVQKRIAAGSPPKKRRFRILGAVPRPVWIAFAVAIVAGAGLLLLSPGRKQRPQMASTIERLLLHLPDWDKAESPSDLPRDDEAGVFSPMQTAIVQALLAGRKSAAATPPAFQEAKPAGEVKRLPPLGLEEMYKILFIDKSVERVLALISS